MTSGLVIEIGRDLLFTALLLSLPTVAVSLAIGLIISIFQTVTSIQEQTLTFAPRIVAVGLSLVIALPWTLRMLVTFTERMFLLVAELSK
ncbi:MAG: flagellar biosynthetic protein FliQ [Planctomycetales bacterium]|nr:flagellar biosynthetic protein FliQ [Planctomycetales bacterium]MCA9169736.1 flagellar biosynthetic protein FliQ [Planctomycetales bacterium]